MLSVHGTKDPESRIFGGIRVVRGKSRPLEIKDLLESDPLKPSFLMCGLAIRPIHVVRIHRPPKGVRKGGSDPKVT